MPAAVCSDGLRRRGIREEARRKSPPKRLRHGPGSPPPLRRREGRKGGAVATVMGRRRAGAGGVRMSLGRAAVPRCCWASRWEGRGRAASRAGQGRAGQGLGGEPVPRGELGKCRARAAALRSQRRCGGSRGGAPGAFVAAALRVSPLSRAVRARRDRL